MVSINPKITPKVSLKLPNSGNGNEGNTQETGNKVDLTGQPYNPGKSVGDLKADTLIANMGIKIGGGKPVDVEAPKAKPQSVIHWDSQEDFERTQNTGIYKVGDTISFMKDGTLYKGVVEEDSVGLYINFTAAGGETIDYSLWRGR